MWYCVCGHLNRSNIKKQIAVDKNERLTRTAIVCEKCGKERQLYKPPPHHEPSKFEEFQELKKPGVIVKDTFKVNPS